MNWANRITIARLVLLYTLPFLYTEREHVWLFTVGFAALTTFGISLDLNLRGALTRVAKFVPWRVVGFFGSGAFAYWAYGLIGDKAGLYFAFALFAIIGVGDWLDGHLARKPRFDADGKVVGDHSTKLGALLDPIVDKVAVVLAMCIILYFGVGHGWALWALVLREFVAVTLRYFNISAAMDEAQHGVSAKAPQSWDELIANAEFNEGDRAVLVRARHAFDVLGAFGAVLFRVIAFLYRATVIPWIVYEGLARYVFKAGYDKRHEKGGLNVARARWVGKVKNFIQIVFIAIPMFVVAVALSPPPYVTPVSTNLFGVFVVWLCNLLVGGFTIYSGVLYVQMDRAYIFREVVRRRMEDRLHPSQPPPESMADDRWLRARPKGLLAVLANYGDSYVMATLLIFLTTMGQIHPLFLALVLTLRFVSWGVEIFALQEGLVSDLDYDRRTVAPAITLWVTGTVLAFLPGNEITAELLFAAGLLIKFWGFEHMHPRFWRTVYQFVKTRG